MEKKKIKMNKIVLNLLAAVLLVVLLVGASWWFFAAITDHGKELSVPDLSFMTVEDAGKVLRHEKLNMVVLDSLYIHSLPRGVVYQQDPLPGSKVKKGRKVRVVINSVLPKKVEIPDLVGYSLRQAKDVLEARGLVLGRLEYVEDIATNNVLEQRHHGAVAVPGRKLESQSVIDLVLGLEPNDNSTYIPDVLGLSRKSAVDDIFGNSLNVEKLVFDETVHNYADSMNAVVYRQVPAHSAYPVSFGEEVALYLTMDTSRVPTPKTAEVEKK